ncbi:MAG: galactosyldiacylglycerol synthase [Anaerolineae bacterium]
MVHIYNDTSDEFVGSISDEDFAFMQRDLEEESLEDTNYYINQATVDMFEQQGASPALVAVLRTALADAEDVDIRWEHD